MNYLYPLRKHPRSRIGQKIFGDLKWFEPKTMCPIVSVRDREER
jgi:hypothetical protein